MKTKTKTKMKKQEEEEKEEEEKEEEEKEEEKEEDGEEDVRVLDAIVLSPDELMLPKSRQWQKFDPQQHTVKMLDTSGQILQYRRPSDDKVIVWQMCFAKEEDVRYTSLLTERDVTHALWFQNGDKLHVPYLNGPDGTPRAHLGQFLRVCKKSVENWRHVLDKWTDSHSPLLCVADAGRRHRGRNIGAIMWTPATLWRSWLRNYPRIRVPLDAK